MTLRNWKTIADVLRKRLMVFNLAAASDSRWISNAIAFAVDVDTIAKVYANDAAGKNWPTWEHLVAQTMGEGNEEVPPEPRVQESPWRKFDYDDEETWPPDDGSLVLTYYIMCDGKPDYGLAERSGKWMPSFHDGGTITHWMPLPEPPQTHNP